MIFCGHDGELTIEEQDPGDTDPRIGKQLGDYVLVARVADGGMGRVYEARHVQSRDRVAIKVLHDVVAKDDVAVERFRREYETADSLNDPYIVEVLDFGETDDGSHYLTMEFLEGEELSKVLAREGAQRPARAVRLLSQIALGLQHAHSYGVIHRDLKPDNIFVCPSEAGETVRILDFGSVKLQMGTGPKLTALGTTLGSPYYMSPEQAMGKLDVDQRTDVFALAAIMHEFATGRVAFEGGNVAEILMKIMQHDPPPASAANAAYPASYDDVIGKGLKKDKGMRFGTTVELAQEMLRAFGLDGDVSKWASVNDAELEARLGGTTTPQPAPYGSPAGSEAPREHSFDMHGRSSIPELPLRSGVHPAVWVLGVAAIVAAAVGAYFFFV